MDAKCVDGKRHACKLPPPSCVGIVNDFNSGLKPKARIDGKFLDDKDYRNHKYLLNLPGAASGSYSKNLNHLWRTGSVVMQWVHPFVEWYRLGVFTFNMTWSRRWRFVTVSINTGTTPHWSTA